MPAWVPSFPSCSIAVDRWRSRLERRDTEALPGAPGGPGARAFARAAFCAASHSDARRVVETGVARGITSRCLLEALAGEGHLWSIDMLPSVPGPHENGAFVELVDGLSSEQWAVGQQEHKAALFGIAVRPLESASGR